MGRKKESLVDAILDASSRMPWWVGVVLAVVLFLGLRRVAGLEGEPATSLDQFGRSIGRGLFSTMAMLGQWIIPPLFLAGAALSAWKQYRRGKLHADVTGDPGATLPGALPRPEATTLHALPPSCPICSSPMVERTARKGALAGKPFWGCSRYPACRGIRSHRPVGA